MPVLTPTKPGTTSNFVEYTYDEGVTRVTKYNDTTGKLTTYVSDLMDIEDGEEKLAVFANGDLKLATITSGTGGTTSNTTCSVPTSGDWTVTTDCTIADFQTAPGNVTVNANVVLTIAPTGILEVDFASSDLLVKDTGGVLIKLGGSLAQPGRLSPPQSGTEENLLVFHHADHLTGASVDTNDTGTMIQLTDYYPFGDSRIEDTTTTFHNDYTYTGKERDEDTELVYYEARYYDSTLGRFLSLDPWKGDITDPQSLNKYAYVRNNPLKYVDPTGKITEIWIRTDETGERGDFGHSMIRITQDGYDRTFGFWEDDEGVEHMQYMTEEQRNTYVQRSEGDQFTVFRVDIDAATESELRNELEGTVQNQNTLPEYNTLLFNCTDYVQQTMLDVAEINLGTATTPRGFASELYNNVNISDYDGYTFISGMNSMFNENDDATEDVEQDRDDDDK